MERLASRKKREIDGDVLRAWGMVFLAAGVAGRAVIQNGMLGIANIDTQQILQVIDSSSQAMKLATISLVLQGIETCAVPIFALLLAEGMQHTKDFKAYFLRILKLALLTEIPYNIAMGGSLLLNSLDPFGIARWVPNVNDVKSARVQLSYMSSVTLDTPEEIADVITLHSIGVAERLDGKLSAVNRPVERI